MADIATMIGALIPTFLLSRLILWLMKSWNGGIRRLIVAHAGALLIASFIGGMGMADGGAFAGARAISLYALPQFVWFLLDLFRHRSGTVRASVKLPARSPHRKDTSRNSKIGGRLQWQVRERHGLQLAVNG